MDKTIASTIMNQIGCGALYMMGGKDYVAEKSGLSFRIRGSKIANHVQVTLNPSDTYTIVFRKIWGMNVTVVETINDIYCDQLTKVIGETVGLATKL